MQEVQHVLDSADERASQAEQRALKAEEVAQLDTYERVKDKVSSTSAPFSLARQRLQRPNSGINVSAASSSRQGGAKAGGEPAAAGLAPLIAQSSSARDQVDAAFVEYGPEHNIVAFMQSLGYSDFTASPEEDKLRQFKRALKLTRPAFAATRSPMQQELANAVYAKLQSWVDHFVYRR